ncbi:hypothetical protein BH09BAC1_BH09BAC1_28120 [soil metagenome]
MAEETPRLYLTDVNLKGYKSIKDTQATFNEGINIIIGPNGSGKTNFLEYLDKTVENKIVEEAINGRTLINFIISSKNRRYSIKTDIDYFFATLDPEDEELRQLPEDTKSVFIYYAAYLINDEEVFYVQKKAYKSIALFDDEIYAALDIFLKANEETFFKEEFLNFPLTINNYDVQFLRYNLANSFTKLAEANTLTYTLKRFGRYAISNLDYANPLVLLIENLFAKETGESIEMEEMISLVINSFSRNYSIDYQSQIALCTPVQDVRVYPFLHASPKSTHIEVNFLIFEFKIGNDWFLWKQLSDGTKRAFSIAISVLKNEHGPILLEEPELGLYPDQLQKLLTFIKEQSSRLQFIITTHSPDVLDILGIDELDKINICEMKGEEGTKIRKMTEKERTAVKGYYDEFGVLSDYWRYENFGLSK